MILVYAVVELSVAPSNRIPVFPYVACGATPALRHTHALIAAEIQHGNRFLFDTRQRQECLVLPTALGPDQLTQSPLSW